MTMATAFIQMLSDALIEIKLFQSSKVPHNKVLIIIEPKLVAAVKITQAACDWWTDVME